MALILSIDDSHTTLEIVQQQLKKLGHIALLAGSGEEGLELARTGNPDVILLDLIMPEMDGFEVLEQLQNNTATRHIPVIIISSETTKENVMRSMKYSARDYLSKKFTLKTFKEKIDNAVEFSKAQKQALIDQLDKPLVIINQLGKITLSFRTGINESIQSVKKTVNSKFLRQARQNTLILDLRYIPRISPDEVPLVEELVSMIPVDPLHIVAGKHFGTILLNSDLEEKATLFISWSDMELHCYTQGDDL